MKRMTQLAVMVLATWLGALTGEPVLAFLAEFGEPVKKDVPYVPTPEETVADMLRLAQVDSMDVVYDLGSGDGRIVIVAAKQYGARGVGIDIDPQRIRESNENALEAGVADRVQFIQGNLYQADLSGATVVTMYLLPRVNLELRPRLLSMLRPGTPVVSHAFDMGDWQPDQTSTTSGRTVYLWIIPANVNGTWSCNLQGSAGEGAGSPPCSLDFTQSYQRVSGTANIAGEQVPIEDGYLRGDQLMFSIIRAQGGKRIRNHFSARVEGDSIQGNMQREGESHQVAWSAQRQAQVSGLAQ
jgi:SAM-dependent methyltransferase